MPLALKINHPGGTFVLRGLADDTTLGLLKEKVAESVPEYPPAEQKFKCGFPPADLQGSDASLLSELGIKSGTALALSRKSPEESIPPVAVGSSSSAAPPIALNSEEEDLKKRLMEMGFSERVAKKALEMSNYNLETAFEMCIGGVVTDASFEGAPGSAATAGVPARPRKMVRRVIDADNSCLFNAIGYLMERDLRSGARLRRLISDSVLSNPHLYTEAVLGKPPREYASWIQKPETWGGEIELFVLSGHYRIEIVAIEIRSLHCYCYGRKLISASCCACACGLPGEGKSYPNRIFVLYDGVHYDAIAAAESDNAPSSADTTQFSATDEDKKQAAIALAAELKSRRQFVDLAGCTLRCMVCDKAFLGQKEAIAHAGVTKHQNFGEV